MDDMVFDTPIEWRDEELCLLPPGSPVQPVDPLVQYEQKMITKYGVDRSFIKPYVKHATERSSKEILRNSLMLPPGREDRALIEKCAAQAIKTINDHDADFRTRMDAVSKEFVKAAQARNEREKKILQENAEAMAQEYFKMAGDAWKAVQTLQKCAELEPIDAKEFHREMRSFIRLSLSTQMRTHFPELADRMM